MIQVHVDLAIDPAKEQEMLRYFQTVFRPAATKFRGYIDVRMLKVSAVPVGTPPPGINYRFAIDLRERRPAAEVGCIGYSSGSLGRHGEHAVDAELHRHSVRGDMRHKLLLAVSSFVAVMAGALLAQQDAPANPQTLAERIAHTLPAKYRPSPSVHGGPGQLDYMALFNATALDTNLYFLHRGIIQPKSGIGAHFHNQCEEMFVIFDGEAQFTIDGRTSVLKGPAGAPVPHGTLACHLQPHRQADSVDEHQRIGAARACTTRST